MPGDLGGGEVGQLGNPDAWERLLDDAGNRLLDDAVLEALQRWLKPKDYRLDLEEWFDDGKSGEPVGRVTLNWNDRRVKQVVIKFLHENNWDRVNILDRAQRNSGDFRRHLAEVDGYTDDLHGWRAVFMTLAGGGLQRVKQLTKLTEEEDFAQLCGEIAGSTVHGWNPNGPRQRDHSITVGEFLGDVLRRRLPDIRKWLRDRGIDVTGAAGSFQSKLSTVGYQTNPYSFVEGRHAALTVRHVLIGNAHGDLNGRNILVPRHMPAAELYHLIDYDRFHGEAPLARDPMNLLVSLATDLRAQRGNRRFESALAEVLVDPEASGGGFGLNNFREASLEVRRRTAPHSSSALDDEWDEQCLLALVGAALLRLGRTTLDEGAKEWCLYVASLAVETFDERFVAPKRTHESHTAEVDGLRAARHQHGMVDRHKDLQDLRTRLTNEPWGVKTLLGTRGVGKTKLVDVTIDFIKNVGGTVPAQQRPRIHQHSFDVSGQLDAKTFVDYLQDNVSGPAPDGSSAVVRLETVLRSLGGAPVIVVIDGADSLLNPDTFELVDPHLDAALETVATEVDHKVTVLLVSRERPVSPGDFTWTRPEGFIPLRSFDPPELLEYMEGLARDTKRTPEKLPDDVWRRLYRSLQGNPRRAELAHAVVTIARTDLDLTSLTDALDKQASNEVHDYLTHRMLSGLNPTRTQVIGALAAFGTPVPVSAVVELVRDAKQATVRKALRDLATYRVIHKVGDKYAVPSQDATLILGAPTVHTKMLYFLAATQLGELRNTDPRRVSDLQTHFAEITALLNAGDHDAAYGAISATHDVLRQWNCDHLLLSQREKLKPKLQNEAYAMSNHNALAHIYESLGKLGAADEYEAAYDIASRHGLDQDLIKIEVNRGKLYLGRDNVEVALKHFKRARDLAARFDDQQALMGALDGMARCLHRRGDYERAMELAVSALLLPDHPSFPQSVKGQTFAATSRVEISLWLARRHTELGQRHHAERMVNAAWDIAAKRPNNWLQAPCRDGQADLLFDLGRLGEAREVAVDAVALAQETHNEEVLQRARATLAMVYLSTDLSREAWIEIDKLHRLPKSCRSLFALALRAVAGHQKGYEALPRFQDLFTQSAGRAKNDPKDFAAWNFRGFALCGLHLHRGENLAEAVVSFRKAQALTPPSRMLTSRVRFLVEQLHETEKLRTVLDALT